MRENGTKNDNVNMKCSKQKYGESNPKIDIFVGPVDKERNNLNINIYKKKKTRTNNTESVSSVWGQWPRR